MKTLPPLSTLALACLLALGGPLAAQEPSLPEAPPVDAAQEESAFQYEAERFADVRILRYQVPGFEALPLQQKKLLYYLSQAGLAGRDIIWDQHYRHNLRVRRSIEEIVKHYPGNRETEDFRRFMVYARQVWFANGIHHHYANTKFVPAFSPGYFATLLEASAPNADFPLDPGMDVNGLRALLEPILFDPQVAPRKVNTSPNVDKILASAVNFYQGVSEQEVMDFYGARIDPEDPTPVSWGLNSRLVKDADGDIKEVVWKLDGLYGEAITEIVRWLELAAGVAENDAQRAWLELLVQYYRSGDLEDFDAFNVAWVEDTQSQVDAINGFIEVYSDPLGYRGSYESVVSFRDEEATRRIGAIAANAQWFEDHSPILDEHKKDSVVGILGKAITVVSESGDASPATPIGINLPNSPWIRAEHGSKSVSLSNITAAYNATESGALEEFGWSPELIARERQYAELGGHLFTDMHEVIGHASGRLEPGVPPPRETLKQYASPMEEARADLVALYYLMDPYLVEIGVMPSLDLGRAEYDAYIRNGLMTQLYRIEPGAQLEEAHMRNRQEVAAWAYERGLPDNVIERRERDGKTFFVINDYERLREIFGELLREHQRIASTGDFEAAQNLIENYGTRVDPALHAEVRARYAPLNVAPYSGFINPRLVPVQENGEIVDVLIEYPDDFVAQMLEYAEQHSFLPTVN